MNVTCKDRDRIFEDGTSEEWASLEGHAVTCASCAEELRSWKSLSVAAVELRDYKDSAAPWPRIHQALVDVEHAESAYVQAIDKLAVEAKPQLENPTTAIMANYREKLMVLDSAIDDLRAQTGQNPSNAHLRYQLLAMYQEKQRTLEEILEEKR